MPIDRGCVYSKAIQFKTRSNGLPIDISTWEFEASLKGADGTEQLAMSTTEGHFTVFDGPNGWMRILVPPDETIDLEAGPVSAAFYRTDGERTRLGKFSELVRDPE
jgi:hypothetical protein